MPIGGGDVGVSVIEHQAGQADTAACLQEALAFDVVVQHEPGRDLGYRTRTLGKNLTGSTYFGVSQCVAIPQSGPYRFTTRLRLEAPESLVAHTLVCTEYKTSDCSGAVLGEPTISLLDEGGLAWAVLAYR